TCGASPTFRCGAELQAFLHFADRYERIICDLSGASRTIYGWRAADDSDISLRLIYLNLRSEELCLWRSRLLSPAVWNIWEAEMRSMMASPPYVQAWTHLADSSTAIPTPRTSSYGPRRTRLRWRCDSRLASAKRRRGIG